MKDIYKDTQPLSHVSPSIRKIIEQFVRETKQLLPQKILKEYVFGSYASHTQTPSSDIESLEKITSILI